MAIDRVIEDVPSIYKEYKADAKYLTPQDLEEAGYGVSIKNYSFDSSGVREKLIDMAQIENRLPTDTMHVGLVRYMHATLAIRNPAVAARIICHEIANSSNETAMGLLMDEGCFPLAVCHIGIGVENGVSPNYDELLKCALLCDAKKVIIIHNHSMISDGGMIHYAPSEPDYVSFYQTINKFKLFGIDVIDSLIMSENYDSEKNVRHCGLYSIMEKTSMVFFRECEVVTEADRTRKYDSNHEADFDENGKRIRHKSVCLSPQGVSFVPEETEEERSI